MMCVVWAAVVGLNNLSSRQSQESGRVGFIQAATAEMLFWSFVIASA